MKKYQVFISSTYVDLKEDRLMVSKALHHLDCFPTMMEEFPASDQRQLDYIYRNLECADYYIIILGGRLGSIDSDSGYSYTYLEYKKAEEIGIPVIAFIKCDEDGKALRFEEDDIRKKQYDLFFKEVMANRLCKFYSNINEISLMVVDSINEEICRNPQKGWEKSLRTREYSSEKYLIYGKLVHAFSSIGKDMYNPDKDKQEIISISKFVEQRVSFASCISTQNTFFFGVTYNNISHNFYDDIPVEYVDKEGMILDDVILQTSLIEALDHRKYVLFSVGRDFMNVQTRIFSYDNNGFTEIANIESQYGLYIDENAVIFAEYGSQGLYDSYVICNNSVFTEKFN